MRKLLALAFVGTSLFATACATEPTDDEGAADGGDGK